MSCYTHVDAYSYRRGFTLFELLVAMAIIGILIGMVIGLSGVASKKSAESKARTDLQHLASAIEEYKLSQGGYPNDLNELMDNKNRVPVEFMVNVRTNDPWDRPYVYSDVTRFSYRLYSKGAREDTSADDINMNVQ